MRKKNSLKRWMASAILFSLFISCGQDRRERVDSEVLVVKEQGSFLAGGAAVTTPGIYNENDPTNPAGQTLHGDHAYVFTRNRFMPVNTRWYFCMVTENLQKRGKPHPTGVKDFKISFYGWDSVFIWLISLVGEKPGEV